MTRSWQVTYKPGKLGHTDLVFGLWSKFNSSISGRTITSLRVVVMICRTLVNKRTQTYRHLLTNYIISSYSSAIGLIGWKTGKSSESVQQTCWGPVTHALTCAQLIQYSAVYRFRSLSFRQSYYRCAVNGKTSESVHCTILNKLCACQRMRHRPSAPLLYRFGRLAYCSNSEFFLVRFSCYSKCVIFN